MNELQVFTNPEFGQVRTVTIEEEPWFVGKDVAVALGYESPRAAVSKKVDPEDKGVSEMETPSREAANDHHQRIRFVCPDLRKQAGKRQTLQTLGDA